MIDFTDLIYPPRCIFCEDIIPIEEKELFVKTAKILFPCKGKVCQKCGKLLEDDMSKDVCIDCIKNTQYYDKGLKHFLFMRACKGYI